MSSEHRIIAQTRSLTKMLLFSKWFWFLLIIIVAIWLPSSQKSVEQRVYPSSASLDHRNSLSVPILSLLNEFLQFMHLYLNSTSIALLNINSINFESFGEDMTQQRTVYLRSHHTNEPIQALHNELVHIFFLNITSLELSLINYINHNQFIIAVDLAQSAQNRWAPISFISSSHLPSLATSHSINDANINNNKIRIMTMNLWNYNYWIKRLDLIDEILHKYQPDIIGLQELRIRSRYLVHELYPYNDPKLLHTFQIYDMMTLLTYFSESNGNYQWYSSPAMFFKESTPEQYPEHIVGEGLGIISRYPIIHKHKLKLSRNTNDNLDFHQRLLLGVTVQINKQLNNHYDLLDVYTTHLSLSENARTRTLPEIGEYINDELQISTNKHHKIGAVLMGDFNCEFDYIDPKLDILSSPKFNMADAWKATGRCYNENDKKMKYSYNYRHGNDRKDIWNHDIDGMFTSPNSHYFDDVVVMKPLFDDNSIYDFDAWSKYVYRGVKDKNDEWWRDNRCKKGWTFNTWDMKKRIDYFYVNKELLNQINDIKIVGDDVMKTIKGLDPVGGVRDMFDTLYGSDHRFLYIDIDIN